MSHSTGENSSPFAKPVRVLVVDDDTTCLSIVDAMLKRWNYEVVAVKHPIDALSILRASSGSFDLVVLDVHMPEMNGFKLQQLITKEFNLPVVLMSADNKEAIILKGIESGAVYFISKPVNPDDVKDLWQYVEVKKKNNKSSTGKKNDYGKGKGKEKVVADDHFKGNSDGNESSANFEDQQIPNELKRKYSDKGVDDNNGEGDIAFYSSSRKQKVVWSSELHNRFLEAISKIGLERAVPKKILEEMNVPGLTRENVASHLQKYRIFLKRLADLNSVNCAREKSLSDRFFRSSFMSKKPTPMSDKLRQQQMNPFYSGRGYERFSPSAATTLDSSNNLINSAAFPILETSSTNLLSSGHAQSSLSSNQDISVQTYNQATQSTSKFPRRSFLEPNYNNLTNFDAGSSESPFVTAGNSIQNPNSFNNSNYVSFGSQIKTDQLGQMGFINTGSNCFFSNKGTTLANTDANIYGNHDKLNSTSIPENAVWNYGTAGEFDALFGNSMNNGTASTYNTILPQTVLQPYNIGNDFTSQVAFQSSNQDQDRDGADFWSSFHSFRIGEMDVPMVKQFTDKQQQPGAEPTLIASNSSSSINQSNVYSPWINQNLMNQRDDDAFLNSVLGIGPGPGPGPGHGHGPGPIPIPSPYDQAN